MSHIDIQGSQVIDLSQAIEPGIPVPVGFPAPEIDVFMSQQRGDIANVEIVQFSVHTATHCDAPFHFFSELRHVDEIPPDALIGPAVVVDLTDKQGSAAIGADDIQAWEARSGEAIKAGDIVLLHTNHSRHWQTGAGANDYWEKGWPYLDQTAVNYLAEKPIRAVGVESFDPDWVNPHDLASAKFPSHRTFLPKGIYILENLTNLHQIPGTRCQIIALPLKLKGCSGSPVRVIAVI